MKVFNCFVMALSLNTIKILYCSTKIFSLSLSPSCISDWTIEHRASNMLDKHCINIFFFTSLLYSSFPILLLFKIFASSEDANTHISLGLHRSQLSVSPSSTSISCATGRCVMGNSKHAAVISCYNKVFFCNPSWRTYEGLFYSLPF